MYSESNTPFRTDFDVLLGVPEQLFVEFGERCGKLTENEPLWVKDGETHMLRHLNTLNPAGLGPWSEEAKAVLFLEQENHSEDRWATLYYFAQFSRIEPFDSLERPINADLKLVVSKRKIEERYAEPEWEIRVSMDFKYSEGFNLTWYGNHWLLVSALLDRFAKLTHGFPCRVRIRDGRVLLGVED